MQHSGRDIIVRLDNGRATFYRDGRVSPPAPTRPLKAIVCGGRDYADYELVRAVLDALNIGILVHGAARGADSLAARAATELGITQIACPADWQTHGRRAGMLRNLEMLEHKPDLVIAFPGGRGTAHMASVAERAGIAVYRISRKEV